jgi:hypothetical protein
MKDKEQLRVAQEEVLRKAIEYARMKSFGIGIDNEGRVIQHGANDVPEYVEYLKDQLARSAENLLIYMSVQIDGVHFPEEEYNVDIT